MVHNSIPGDNPTQITEFSAVPALTVYLDLYHENIKTKQNAASISLKNPAVFFLFLICITGLIYP